MARIEISSVSNPYGTGELQLQGKVAMSGTLTSVTDNLNTASPLKLSTGIVQVVSTLRVTTNDNPYFDAEDGAGNNRFTIGRDSSSQQVNVDFASNPTGSTTIVGAIRTYVDGTNLSEIMTFREDGNVGIATNTPTSALTFGASKFITFTNGSFNGYVGEFALNNILNIGTSSGFPIAFRPDNNEKMRIASGGNVGINTTTPTAQLHIKGSGSTSATTSLLVQNSGGTDLLKVQDNGLLNIGNAGTTGECILNGFNIVMFKLNDTANAMTLNFYKNAGNNYIIDSNSNTSLAYGWSSNYFWRLNGSTKSMAISSTTSDPTAHSSSIVDFQSTTKGFLPPRMTTIEKNAIVSPAIGLMVFDTTLNRPCFYNGIWVTL